MIPSHLATAVHSYFTHLKDHKARITSAPPNSHYEELDSLPE